MRFEAWKPRKFKLDLVRFHHNSTPSHQLHHHGMLETGLLNSEMVLSMVIDVIVSSTELYCLSMVFQSFLHPVLTHFDTCLVVLLVAEPSSFLGPITLTLALTCRGDLWGMLQCCSNADLCGSLCYCSCHRDKIPTELWNSCQATCMKGTRESEKASIETSQILFSSEKLNISRQGSRINFNMPAAIPMMWQCKRYKKNHGSYTSSPVPKLHIVCTRKPGEKHCKSHLEFSPVNLLHLNVNLVNLNSYHATVHASLAAWPHSGAGFQDDVPPRLCLSKGPRLKIWLTNPKKSMEWNIRARLRLDSQPSQPCWSWCASMVPQLPYIWSTPELQGIRNQKVMMQTYANCTVRALSYSDHSCQRKRLLESTLEGGLYQRVRGRNY